MHLKELLATAPPEITRYFKKQQHPKGSFIIPPEEKNSRLYFLIAGQAEVYQQNTDGAILSLYTYEAYRLFGEAEIFDEGLNTVGVLAKEDCQTLSLEKEYVLQWLKKDFRFNLFLLKDLSKKLNHSSRQTAKLALLPLKDRVLLSIYQYHQLGKLASLTKKNLTNEVAAPLRSVNRVLSHWEKEGVVAYEKKHFIILSLDKLLTYVTIL